MLSILTEVIGILGIVAAILAFQCKKYRNLMFFRTANTLLFALQYGILGAFTGMAMNLIGGVRNIIFMKMVEQNKNTMRVRYLFSGIILLFILFTWEGPKSLLSGIANMVTTFAYGSKRTFVVRSLTLCTSFLWLFYNILVSSTAGVICEVLTLISTVVGIIRIDVHEKKTGA